MKAAEQKRETCNVNLFAVYSDIARGEGERTTHLFVLGWMSNAQMQTEWKPLGNYENYKNQVKTRVKTNRKTYENHENYKKKEASI